MAADLTLTRASENSNVGRIASLTTVQTIAVSNLNYLDVTTTAKIYYRYGETDAAFGDTAKSMVLAGMCRSIPRDPNVNSTSPWYISVVADAGAAEIDFVAYNQGGA